MVLTAAGQDTEARDYSRLLHRWLSYNAVWKLAQKHNCLITATDFELLNKKKLSRERAAFWLRRLTVNKQIRRVVIDCILSDPKTQEVMAKGVKITRKGLKADIFAEHEAAGHLAKASKAGLVLP